MLDIVNTTIFCVPLYVFRACWLTFYQLYYFCKRAPGLATSCFSWPFSWRCMYNVCLSAPYITIHYFSVKKIISWCCILPNNKMLKLIIPCLSVIHVRHPITTIINQSQLYETNWTFHFKKYISEVFSLVQVEVRLLE